MATAFCDLKYTPGICIINSHERGKFFLVTSDGFPQIKCSILGDSFQVLVYSLCGEEYKEPKLMTKDEIQREMILILWRQLEVLV